MRERESNSDPWYLGVCHKSLPKAKAKTNFEVFIFYLKIHALYSTPWYIFIFHTQLMFYLLISQNWVLLIWCLPKLFYTDGWGYGYPVWEAGPINGSSLFFLLWPQLTFLTKCYSTNIRISMQGRKNSLSQGHALSLHASGLINTWFLLSSMSFLLSHLTSFCVW